jgi:hypothetical protein
MSERQRKRRESRRRRHSETNPMRRRLLAAGGLTAGATLAMSGVAHAAPETLTVGSNADTTGASDCTTASNTDCTLRQAILDANANTGADTIVFASALSGQTITLTAAPQFITEAVSIQGPGAAQLTVDGADSYRDFGVEPTTSGDPVSISGLTITDGHSIGADGGAIYSNGADLTISNSLVSGSSTQITSTKYTGGGIFSVGNSLMIDHSTVIGNHAYAGGGVGARYGTVTVSDSTITGNHADGDPTSSGSRGYGGGVWGSGADFYIEGSTIDHNVASFDGGGIYMAAFNSSGLTIRNSTVSSNHAQNDDGGGIWTNNANTLSVTGSTVVGNTAATTVGGIEAGLDSAPVLQNSIVSGNTATSHNTDDVYASFPHLFDAAFSLIGVPHGYVNETVPGSNLAAGTNPKLGPLQDNGGPTETMAPLKCSPVIDKGRAFGLTEDQRGLTRPVDLADYPNSGAAGADGSDIGSVELQSSPGTNCSPPPPPVTPVTPVTPSAPNCHPLRKKLKRQKARLKHTRRKPKRSMIHKNIKDTKGRLAKRGC